jgi:hypothetical protein
MTAPQLAVALNAPAALAPMTLEQFFAAVVAAGGAPGELAKLWAYQQYVIWANEALNAGDYARTMALLATMPETLNEATQTAITTVISGAMLAAVAKFWPADAVDAPPAEVTSEDVTAALAAAGFGWDGTTWNVEV